MYVNKRKQNILVFAVLAALLFLLCLRLRSSNSDIVRVFTGDSGNDVLKNNDDVTGGSHNIERRTYGGWGILHDEDALRYEVERIHTMYFDPPSGEQCVRRPPDCVVAGIDKTGTVELVDFMSIHPNIVTKWKPYLFHRVKDFRPSVVSDMPCAYRNQVSMSKADGLYMDPNRPSELLRLNPNMKIIILVREPISRMKSSLTFRPTHDDERLVIEDAKTLKQYIHSMLKKPAATALDLSTYDTYFEKYLKVFKRESILVMENIEFMHNPSSVFKKVENFLGIKSFNSENHFVINPESKFHCIRKFDRSAQNMVCYERNRGRNASQGLEIDAEDKETLRRYFKPHNENFFKMIGNRYDW